MVMFRNERVVIEGLSYIHHSYLAFQFVDEDKQENAFGKGKQDILEVLQDLRADDKLYKELKDKVMEKRRTTEKTSSFQYRLRALVEMGTQIREYVRRIAVPDFEDKSGAEIMWWVIGNAIKVYQGSVLRNNFFVLHLVTSAWALLQIIKLFKDRAKYRIYKVFFDPFFINTSLFRQMDIIESYMVFMTAAYLGEGKPELSPKQLYEEPSVENLTWEDIKKELFAIPVNKADEHTFKLVFVSMDCAKQDPKLEDICKRAALTGMRFPLSFCNEDDQ